MLRETTQILLLCLVGSIGYLTLSIEMFFHRSWTYASNATVNEKKIRFIRAEFCINLLWMLFVRHENEMEI